MLSKYFSYAVGLLSVALVAGCATRPTVSMTASDRAALRTVSMQSSPQIPTDIYFNGRAQSFAAAGGALGAVLAAGVPKEPKEKLLEAMKANDIQLAAILKTEFFKAASAHGAFSLADPGSATQGDVSLNVNIYGFGQTQGLSALLFPMISVTATIKKPNGEIAWQHGEFVTPLNSQNKYGYEFEEYLKDPELIRKTLTNIAAIVSNMLVESLVAGK